MERTPMERHGWWFETDCHMEFEPEDPQAFGWQERRMKGWVSRCHGRWHAHIVKENAPRCIAVVKDREQAMEHVERRCAQRELFTANAMPHGGREKGTA